MIDVTQLEGQRRGVLFRPALQRPARWERLPLLPRQRTNDIACAPSPACYQTQPETVLHNLVWWSPIRRSVMPGHLHIIRNMIAITFAYHWQQMVAAQNHLS